MTGELDLENWLALAFVMLGVHVAVWWSGRGAVNALKKMD